jgi:hypothetical protein
MSDSSTEKGKRKKEGMMWGEGPKVNLSIQ